MDDREIIGFKKQYNNLLMRHYKAAVFLDNNEIPIADREKWLPEYGKILEELNYILSLFEHDGVKYTTQEALGGFDI